jgi:hypothetical protein
MTRMATTTLIIAALVIGGFLLFRKKSTNNTSSKSTQQSIATEYKNEDAEKFANRLQELGYFKYANTNEVDTLHKNMIEGYDPTNELVSIWDDHSMTPKDYRYYFCDGEELYEEGGLTSMLKILQPTFNKIGLTINVTDHYEVWDNNKKWLNHTITINGKKYVVFKNFKEMGWGEAAQRLAEILNEELDKQHKEERVYLVSGANDGRIIFLTDQQFSYIDSVYTNKQWKPLKVKDWCKAMEVKYMSVD